MMQGRRMQIKNNQAVTDGVRYMDAVIEGISVPVGTPEADVLQKARQKMKRAGLGFGSLHFRLFKGEFGASVGREGEKVSVGLVVGLVFDRGTDDIDLTTAFNLFFYEGV